MDILIQQQRLRHIVESYALAGEERDLFAAKLSLLEEGYPWFLIELALVEVLVQNWLKYPLPRGLAFLQQVEARLKEWRSASNVSSLLTPVQFEQVTGLTPLSFRLLHAMSTSFPGAAV